MALRAAAIAVGVSLVTARVWTGTTDGSDFPFLGTFSFGPQGAAVGTASITYSYSGNAPVPGRLLAFSTAHWSPTASCENMIGTADTSANLLPLAPPQSGTMALDFSATQPTTSWSFAISSIVSPTTGTGCAVPGPVVSYTLTVLQADGGQLSYEELGLPAVYGCFWAIAAVIFGAHVWAHYVRMTPAFAPAIVRVFTLTLALHMMSDLFHLIEWSVVARSGSGNVGLNVCGGLLRLAALSCTWALAGLVAVGYGVSSYAFGAWTDRANWSGAAILGALVLTNLVVSMLYAVQRTNDDTKLPASAAAAAIFLLIFTIAYIVWFVRRARLTIAAEVSVPKRVLMQRLMWALVAAFNILPFAELLSLAIPRYESLRVVVGCVCAGEEGELLLPHPSHPPPLPQRRPVPHLRRQRRHCLHSVAQPRTGLLQGL